MTIFYITTDRGDFFVPAEAVDYIQRRYPKGKSPGFDVHLRNGEILRSSEFGSITTIETLTNTTPFVAIIVWAWGDDGHQFKMEPILGWRTGRDLLDPERRHDSAPILLDSESVNEMVGILNPGTGRVVVPFDREFESVDEFVGYAVEDINARAARKLKLNEVTP
jgi:hypothetical protein